MPPEVITEEAPEAQVPPQAEPTLGGRDDVQRAVEALFGDGKTASKPEAAKPDAKAAEVAKSEAKPDAAKPETGKPDGDEPEEGLTHGQKSFQGKLQAEAQRLKAERDALVAEKAELERLKAGAAKPQVQESAKPEGQAAPDGKQSESQGFNLHRLDPSEWDAPEFVEAHNKLVDSFESSMSAATKQFESRIKDLEHRLSEAEVGARVAQGLAQREVHQFMTREGERAAGLFTQRYEGVNVTPDDVWKAVSDYQKLNPEFQATDQASYTDDKWMEILEQRYALQILRAREAKEQEAKRKSAPRPPVTAAGASTAKVADGKPSSDGPLLSPDDTRRALESILRQKA